MWHLSINKTQALVISVLLMLHAIVPATWSKQQICWRDLASIDTMQIKNMIYKPV